MQQHAPVPRTGRVDYIFWGGGAHYRVDKLWQPLPPLFLHPCVILLNMMLLGTVVFVSSGIDFVNTPRLYSDRATSYREIANLALWFEVTIESSHFNCICYADDLLLCSTTLSGLQHLMDVCNSYIKDHGLTFNPEKSTCFMIGTNPFSSVPQSSLDGINVSPKESITFLGSVLGDGKGSGHCDFRVRNTTRSFYALQGAGIKYHGVSPVISLK